MDEEKYQKELFPFEKPKRFFPKLSDFFPKGDFERNVVLTLTLDRAVFIAIGILMVMGVLYALGVETGRSRIVESARPVPVPAPAVMPQVVKVGTPQAVIKTQPVIKTQVAPVVKTQIAVKAPAAPVPAQALPNADRPYTIVAVTFVNKDTALQEINKLKKQGYSVTLIQSDRYFQVCIGAYTDKAGAEIQKDLKKVRRLYKDAYLRLR